MHSRISPRRAAVLANPVGQYLFALLPALAMMVSVGCSSSSVTSGPTNAKCELTLAPPANIVAEGGTAVLSVSAQPECGWAVSTQASWISDLAPTSGQGNGKVEFLVAPNPVPVMREDDIAINDNRVRVRQEAALCLFTIDEEQRTVPSTSGTASVVVSAHQTCRWTARSNVGWITITSGVEGAGNGRVGYRVNANPNSNSRTGTITIGDRTHTVFQYGGS